MHTKQMSYEQIYALAGCRKSTNYKYTLRRFRDCFTGNMKNDIALANTKIDNIIKDSTAHSYVSCVKWAYDLFYGQDFNHKTIRSRPNIVSKFTTRLTEENINTILTAFELWINESHDNMIPNKLESVKHARLKLLHCFKILLSSGMRVGELVNIDFTRDPCQRIVTSILDKSQMAEIIINTEKTCKKREIYVPLDSYEFMKHDKRPLTRSMIIKSFIEFRKHMHLPFNLTAHVCRRTLATMMHESGVDVATIAMVLGNTPGVVMNHYILSSGRNYDACEIAYAKMSGVLTKTNNVFVNREWMSINQTNHKTPGNYQYINFLSKNSC